jgi:hypothetical protein
MLMQPDQQPTTPPPITVSPSGQPNYDFIMNPETKKRKGLFPGGNSPKQRLLMVAIGGGILLVVIFMFLSLLFGGGNEDVTALVSITQEQEELIRVSDIGVQKSKTPATQNLAITTKLTIQTSQNQTLERLKKLGRNIKPKDLTLKKDSKTDETLDAAALSNRFDETFVQLLKNNLITYQASVRAAYDVSKSTPTRQVLGISYDSAGILATEQVGVSGN